MTRGHLSPSTLLHLEIARVLREDGPGPTADAALARCPDAECRRCAILVCPHADPMHFHHDGCPGCAEHETERALEPCSSCGGSGCQGTGPGYGGCTDCLGTGKQQV